MIEEDEIDILQGEDADCEFTLEQVDGTPLDMSAPSTKVYALISDGYGTIVAKYKNGSGSSGWVVMNTTLLNVGTVKFSVFSTITKDLEPGKYYVETRARFPSGIHTDDSYYDVGERAYAFTVVKSDINTLSSLP